MSQIARLINADAVAVPVWQGVRVYSIRKPLLINYSYWLFSQPWLATKLKVT
jgi:hypothetical protein